MKMGFCLALGQLGWSAPPAQEAIYYMRLARHIKTCCLDVVHTDGLMAVCRLMYTQEGGPKCTREDGGAIVWYSNVASALWDRMKEHERMSGKQGGRRGAIAWHPMSVSPVAWREAWNDIVYVLPLVDSWPFGRGETRYPTPSVQRMWMEKIRKVPFDPLRYFWPQATGAPQPFTSDLVAPPSRRNSLLPQGGTGSIGEGTLGSGGSRRSSLLPESSSSTCSPRPQPDPKPKPAPVTVWLSRQHQFDQASMQTCHRIAGCVRIAMQGLGEQEREPLSEDSLVGAYTVGRYFADSMRIPMQESSDLLLRCTLSALRYPPTTWDTSMLVSAW